MLYSYKKILIEAPFPTTQCGHLCQTFLVDEIKDNLYGRIFSIKDNNSWIIHLSLDLLSFPIEFRNELEEKLRNTLNSKNINLITSTTHTHYANSVRDDKYVEWLMNILVDGISSMKYEEAGNILSSYQRIKCDVIGKSRISGYETGNEYLLLIRLFNDNKCLLNWLITNSHPTTLDAKTTKYFSAEYPGIVLKKLEEKYPSENFTFSLGPSGDISSRFVRIDQSYNSMLKIADDLFKEVDRLHSIDSIKKEITLDYKEVPLIYKSELTPIDISNIRNDLSQRELDTIKLGQECRENIIKTNSFMGSSIGNQIISSWDLGSLKLVFFPNELFSEYLNYIDLDNKYIVSYSNGYGPYVLPIDFKYITYEMFIDTTSKETKEKIIKMIREI